MNVQVLRLAHRQALMVLHTVGGRMRDYSAFNSIAAISWWTQTLGGINSGLQCDEQRPEPQYHASHIAGSCCSTKPSDKRNHAPWNIYEIQYRRKTNSCIFYFSHCQTWVTMYILLLSGSVFEETDDIRIENTNSNSITMKIQRCGHFPFAKHILLFLWKQLLCVTWQFKYKTKEVNDFILHCIQYLLFNRFCFCSCCLF